MIIRIASAVAIAAALYATNGSTFIEPSDVANDWEGGCHLNVDLRQSGRISLDITKYGKDAINQTEFQLPIACSELTNFEEESEIVHAFRWGSMFTEFSYSNWDMRGSAGETPSAPSDEEVCSLELTLRERHRGIFTHVFIKDAWNKHSFDWPVSCDVHDAVPVGHNFVTDPLRQGSIDHRMRQESPDWAYGTWNVEVSGHNGPLTP